MSRQYFFCIIVLLMLAMPLFGQKGGVEEMKRHKAEIERQIAASEKLLSATDKDIKGQMASLNVITRRLGERKKLMEQTEQEIKELTIQSELLNSELLKLQEQYEECKTKYAEACRFYQKQKSSFNPLLFILSSNGYNQLTRRFRYVREYSKSVLDLADELDAKQQEIHIRQQELEALREQKLSLQVEQAEQERETKNEEKKQRSIVSKLQSKRASLKKEIANQQKEMAALNKEIDRQIELALKRSREDAAKANANEATRQAEADVKLSGNFESTKGKLPVPITGTYLVIGEFGIQNVAGMKDVKMNNLGIDLQGEKGCQARCVFDGVVTTVFQQGKGQIGVLVRHGSYITVYCNLSDNKVSKGDTVKTGDIIGSVANDSSGKAILHFQLHKETVKLNPSEWIKY